MTKEEFDRTLNDLKKAHKQSRQSQWISLVAMALSAIALDIRLVAVLQ